MLIRTLTALRTSYTSLSIKLAKKVIEPVGLRSCESVVIEEIHDQTSTHVSFLLCCVLYQPTIQ